MTSSSSKPNSGVFGGGRKRGSRGRTPTSRARKKQKRLDAILDSPIPPSPLPPSDPFLHYHEEASNLRRSSRARRVPEVLDSSPIPSNRKKNPSPPPPGPPSRRVDKGKETVKTSLSFKERSTRARRARKGKYQSKRASERIKKNGKEAVFLTETGGEDDGGEDEVEDASASVPEKEMDASEQKVEPCREKDDDMARDASVSVPEKEVGEPCQEKDDVFAEDASVGSMPEKEMEASDQKVEVFQEKDDGMAEATSGSAPEKEIEASEQKVEPCREKENLDGNAVVVELTSPSSEDKLSKSRVKEGRRCGLCGGGTDGKPPKKLVRESADSENEAYEGSSASEEPNYDVWDGFGDEPGWLGRLLGPILDRFGIARIWVHQHCAVWSPEVYFAGLGCLKNIRAALCRGRALKCSRCGRPGATIGCRVDRCLKTYHLPCSRAEGCIFDHRKFLIACNHHRHLFQPQGTQYTHQIRKRKAKKLKLELRKLSNDAWRKDVEAEEKWLENCGEDEEFLKREGKRLHRDILRIAPTYIGGSSENGNLYRGWESVAGLQDVIRCMKEVVILPLLYPDFFSNMGLTPPRGVLLHGYPGTGKTLVVRALIGACSRGDKRITYFARKGADCLGKYVGDAERQLRLLFQVAERCQPSIIFFDEIDGLAPRRSRHQDQTHSSVVSTLLSLMDGLKSRGSVIVIGATNRPEAVDPALRRPGRFDREIYFPLPSEMDRSAILSLHTQSWPNPISGPLLSWVANQTVGYAGADLQALCTQAAMIALKRNCALQDLLSSAEKGSDCGRLPLLPSFAVEERDWLEALVLAPPPCSQREAGIAANDAVSSPLPAHLTPCLLQPLLHLLISFYNDERIWLPLTIFNASKSIKRVIISALEQKQVPNVFWQSHVHSLIQEPCIENEIVKNLAHYGLVVGPSVISHSCVSDDDNNDHDKFDSFRLKHSGANVRNISMQNLPKCGNLSGFRVLISGAPKSGQRHLASCLLHGFMGHIEILKINLATISQEGHGDLLRGLTQIFSKIVNMGRCMIYMPRIDLWAISETLRQDVEESHITPMTSITADITPMTSITAGANSRTRCVTEIWNSFVEQVASMSASASLIIMATCEVQNQDLPRGMKQFFTNDVLDCGESAPSEHTIPRFFVHIGGAFNHELIINSFSEKLLHDLVQHYVRLLHQKSHKGKSHGEEKVSNVMEINSQTERQSMENGHITTLMDTSIDPERIISSSMASCRNDHAAQGINSDPLPLIRGHQVVGVQHSIHEASFAKVLPSKVTKGSSAVAIGTFGYQILRCPQFAELCWVTSKLREGPLSDINGPWKSWPFNSCVWHDKSSTDTVGTGISPNNLKDSENISVVRGLIAVGLLAYKGVYTSVREVATEVRKVSEILVEQIRAKVLGGKDRYHYLRILSQVAYLEDLVNTWAYTFERSHGSNLTSESNKRVLAGRVYADKSFSDSKLADKQSCEPSSHIKSCNETQEDVLEGGSEKIISSNDHCVKSSEEISDEALCNSGASIIRELEPSREVLLSAQFPSNLRSSPSLAVSTMPTGDAKCSIEVPTPCKRLDGVKQLNGLEVRHISPTMETTDSSVPVIRSRAQEANVHSNGLDTVHSSRNTESVANAPSKVADFTLSTLAASENSCLYKCCSGCLSVICMFVRNTISQSWESNDCYSAIDDIHDIILSCSSNLLVAFKKWCTSKCNTNLTENYSRTQSEHCACQDLCKMKYKNKSAQYKSSSKMDLLPLECRCHLRNDDDSSMIQSEITFSFQPSLTFLYRDGILIPFDYHKDLVLHCKYEKLCLCSIMEMILTIKEQLV